MHKITHNETLEEKLKVYCSICGRESNHLVLKSFQSSDSFENGFQEIISWADDYQIIQCQGCESISFRQLHWCSEDQGFNDPDDISDGTTIYLYPKPSKDMHHIRDYWGLPTTLRRIYRESIDCFNNESYLLCAAGLRAIVEGICSNHGIKSGFIEKKKKDGTIEHKCCSSLQGKIAGLKDKGLLTEKHASILNEHRFLGNAAIHELQCPSKQELTLAIEIIEHILDDLYEVPIKAKDLSKYKANRMRNPET